MEKLIKDKASSGVISTDDAGYKMALIRRQREKAEAALLSRVGILEKEVDELKTDIELLMKINK
jgi:hypothetical protein